MSADAIRAVLQAILDGNEPDGWCVSQFVVVMGLERIRSDGSIDATPWYFAPADQPDWMTGGLLEAAIELRAHAEIDDD